jgi:hypothetical protein
MGIPNLKLVMFRAVTTQLAKKLSSSLIEIREGVRRQQWSNGLRL